MKVHTIYGLVDPRNGALRYIGVTSYALSLRLAQHVHDAHHETFHKARWVKSLLSAGVRPQIFEIDKTTDPQDEVFWIQYFRFIGCNLTNHAPGGEGRRGPLSPETRKRIGDALRGRKQDPDFVKRRTAGAAGRRHSEETKAKQRAAKLGKKASAATRARISAAVRKRVVSEETRKKMSVSLRGKDYSPERIKKMKAGKKAARFFRLLKKSAHYHATTPNDRNLLKVHNP